MKKIGFMILFLMFISFQIFADLANQAQAIGHLTQAKVNLEAYISGIPKSPAKEPIRNLEYAGDHLRIAGLHMEKLTSEELKEIEPLYLELKTAFLRALSSSSGR